MEAVNAAKVVKRFVHISTGSIRFFFDIVNFLDEIYGDSKEDEPPKTEESLPNPTNPYAASKAACEFILRSYHVSFNKI